MIKSDGRIIYGLGLGTATRYIDRDGTVREGFWTVVGGGGRELTEPMLALGAYDAPCAVAYATTEVNPTAAYRLSGTAVPAGSTVHLSQIGDGALTPQALAEGEFAAVETDSEGAWSCECPEGRSGTLYAWILLDANVLDTLDAAVTLRAEVVDQEPQLTVLTCRQTVSEGLDNAGGGTLYGLHYDYTCPEDVASIELCEVNGATDTEPCPVCGGSGEAESSGEPCPGCNGSGVETVWEMCPTCNGSGTIDAFFSEPCPACGGSGNIESPITEPCPACGGSGMVEDEACPDCGGSGNIESNGWETCPDCGGSGSIESIGSEPCPDCGGSGGTEREQSCSSCGGSGMIESPITEPCPGCGGSGTVETAGEIETHLADSPVAGGTGSVYVGSEANWYPASGSVTLLWRCRTADPNGTLSVTVTKVEEICLSGDTRITLADGTEKRLDALTAEDTVLGGNMAPARILRLARGQWSPRHILYHFEGGTVIDEVHEHRFFNIGQGFWQKLKNWRTGDRARRIDGAEVALERVEPVEERAEMFGLWVERGSYWANGLLSGDASANRPLLADATAEQAADMAASLDERAVLKLFGMEGMMP